MAYRTSIGVGVAACWFALLGGNTLAATGGRVSFPLAPAVSANGLTLDADTTWVDGPGYRPIRVVIRSAKPTTADQTITFRLKAGTWRPEPVVSVDQDIEMPAGATAVNATVPLPMVADFNALWWDVLVDGQFDKALSLQHRSGVAAAQFGQNYSAYETPAVLIVGSAPLSASNDGTANGGLAFLKLFGAAQTRGAAALGTITINNNGMLSTTGQNNSFADSIIRNHVACLPTELPDDWLLLSSLDVVVIRLGDLESLAAKNPNALDALRRWTAAGGSLWVHGVSGEDAGPRSVDAVIDNDGKGDTQKPRSQRRWRALKTRPTRIGNNELGQLNLPNQVVRLLAAANRRSESDTRIRRFEFGKLLASTDALGDFATLQALAYTSPAVQESRWTKRHGLQAGVPNGDFANLLIPGVGLAPVTEFRILITIFVLLIGPVNFWLLKRWGRLHLLVLTVPLGALGVTFALFAYALVADGLSTRMRAHSVALLDQTSGEAVCWSRLSYYAGLAPSGGLSFSKNVAVYPIVADWDNRINTYGIQNPPSRAVEWDAKQYLTEGWLSSRTPTQFLTVAATTAEKRIDIEPSADGMRVANQLGTDIELLVIRGADGKLFKGESIAADAQAVLPLADEGAVSAVLRRLFSDNAPEFPVGYGVPTRGGFGGRPMGAGRWNAYSSWNGGSNPVLSSNYLEARLASVVLVEGNDKRSVGIDDRGYVAITKSGALVEMGVESFSEEASFHVLVGKW